MKQIQVTIDYPEDREVELLLPIAKKLGYKEGDLHQFVTNEATGLMKHWLKGLMTPPPTKKRDVGFGDTLARWIQYMTKPFIWLSMNCGCDKRRKWLNKHFPYKLKPKSS